MIRIVLVNTTEVFSTCYVGHVHHEMQQFSWSFWLRKLQSWSSDASSFTQ